MLEVRDIRKAFGGFQAVGGVSLTVTQGEIAAIIGPNGAGKTTFFNLITGHLRPDAGAVLLEGRDITGVAPHDVCRLGMGRSFQRTNIFPRLTVFQNVQAAFIAHRGRGRDLFRRVDRLYAELTEAGYTGQREPWDAFWGQRYATVADPDGNGVDLFAWLPGRDPGKGSAEE